MAPPPAPRGPGTTSEGTWIFPKPVIAPSMIKGSLAPLVAETETLLEAARSMVCICHGQ